MESQAISNTHGCETCRPTAEQPKPEGHYALNMDTTSAFRKEAVYESMRVLKCTRCRSPWLHHWIERDTEETRPEERGVVSLSLIPLDEDDVRLIAENQGKSSLSMLDFARRRPAFDLSINKWREPATEPFRVGGFHSAKALEALPSPRFPPKRPIPFPSGRKVYLQSFRMEGTYAGIIEGRPETATPYILEGLRECLRELTGTRAGFLILPPFRIPLAPWMCIAKLYSPQPARTSDSDFASELTIAWFADDYHEGLDSMLADLARSIDWDASAVDFDPTDI